MYINARHTHTSMDTLPYLSEYILCVAAIFLLYQLVAYLPYGKFSIPDAPYSQYHMIHPGVAFSIPFIVGLLLLAIGWFEDGMFHVDKPPRSPKGWVTLMILLAYFGWRVVAQMIVYNVIDPPNGKKRTSIFFVAVQFVYYPAVAMNFRRMCYYITDPIEPSEAAFAVVVILSLIANGCVDILLNVWRKDTSITVDLGYHGRYLESHELSKRFAILSMCGMDPNYVFEIIAWVFFTAFTKRWESFWWLVATLMILIPRMMWNMHWYALDPSKE